MQQFLNILMHADLIFLALQHSLVDIHEVLIE